MKRILSLILAIAVCLSFSLLSLAEVTSIYNYVDSETGISYLFGKFTDGDKDVGFEIDGKEYSLKKADSNDPSKTAFEVADATDNNAFGIGFYDANKIKGESYEATPYWVDANDEKHTGDAVTITNPAFDNTLLADIKIDGTTVEAFSPYKSYYYYNVDDVNAFNVSDIKAVAQADYATTTVASAGNNNYTITTTAPDAEESNVVEIRVRNTTYQNPEQQTVTMTGFKRINIIDYDETGAKAYLGYTAGSSSIYDQSTSYIKASANGSIINTTDSNTYGIVLVQFDISNISNVNNRVYLEVPAHKNSNNGMLGIIETVDELPIAVNSYYSGGKTDEEYATALEEIVSLPDNPTVLTKDMVTYIKNAISMIDVTKLNNEVAPRVLVNNATETYQTKKVDVTDYVKKRIEENEDTVTFGIRAFEIPEYASESQMYISMRGTYDDVIRMSFESYDATLSNLSVGGTTISGFNGNTTYYNYGVDNSLTNAPVVTYTLSDNEATAEIINNQTTIPGQTTVKVTSKDGYVNKYIINFGYNNPYQQGTYTFTGSYRLERNTSLGDIAKPFNRYVESYNENYSADINGRTYNTSGYPREQLMIKFDTNAIGFEDGHEVLLTVNMHGNSTAETANAKVKIVGVENENYIYDSNEKTYGMPVRSLNADYISTCETTLKQTAQDFVYNVTDYVKDKVAAGNSQISFFVEIDTTTSGCNYYLEADKDPTITYIEYDKTLADITIDGTTIEGFDANVYKYDYVVSNDTTVDTLPEIIATASDKALQENATVSIKQPEKIPGKVLITVTAKDKSALIYTINLRLPYEQGTFTLKNSYLFKLSNMSGTVTAEIDNDTSASNRQLCHTQSTAYYKQVYKFTVSAEGINENDEVIMTIPVSGFADMSTQGVAGGYLTLAKATATYQAESSLPTVTYVKDIAYNVISGSELTNLTFDITDYVKEEIENGNDTLYIIAYITLDKGETVWTYADLTDSSGNTIYVENDTSIVWGNNDSLEKATVKVYTPNGLTDSDVEIGDTLPGRLNYLGGYILPADVTIVHNIK